MQKVTITAPTLNEAIQEIKKRFGEHVTVQNTEKIGNHFYITILNVEKNAPIIVPSLQKSEQNKQKNCLNNPLSAIRMVEEICDSHNLGQNFQEFWLKCLTPHLTRTEINISLSLSECINFETQWIRKITSAKPVVYLGSYGVGKTQALAKTAAILTASDRKVEIYNLDTFKTSGKGLLQAYAHKLNVPYYFGKEALEKLQASKENQENTVKLIDTQGVNLKNPKGIEWVLTYSQKFNLDPIMVAPCDSCVSLVDEYANFAKKFGIRNLILSKLDISSSLGLPIRLAWLSEIPIAMINKSASLSDNLEYLDADKLINYLTESGTVDHESNMSDLGIRF